MTDEVLTFPTKGEYLKEKLGNMARWVTKEVGKENLPADIIAGIDGRSELEVTVLCGALESDCKQVTHRNWSGLVKIMEDNNVPNELQQVVVAVQRRPEMHEKFWRYMDLFVEVSQQ